jgi:predicted nucleic acid-binding protein
VKHYYLDTSILLVYTLASGKEPERYSAVEKLFKLMKQGKLKCLSSFYALHEVYIFALENAPDFDTGAKYGKEALALILSADIQITPLLSRIERKINERFFKHLPDLSDMPHAVSAKIWGCEGIVAYDDHFKTVSDVLEYKNPDIIIEEYEANPD